MFLYACKSVQAGLAFVDAHVPDGNVRTDMSLFYISNTFKIFIIFVCSFGLVFFFLFAALDWGTCV